MDEEYIRIPKAVYEAERKMRFFGVSSEEIYEKKHNIFIGISISNKKITLEMAENYLRWACRNAKQFVAVVIADELNVVNYRIFDNYSSGKAKNRAQKVGDAFEQLFRNAAKALSQEQQNMIQHVRWSQVKADEQYQHVHNILTRQYPQDTEFRSAVLYFIKKYMRKKGKIIGESEKVDELATYILGELPTLLQGIYLDDTHYSVCIYPTYFASGMSQFVMDIHAQELDIAQKLKKTLFAQAGLIEAWLD